MCKGASNQGQPEFGRRNRIDSASDAGSAANFCDCVVQSRLHRKHSIQPCDGENLVDRRPDITENHLRIISFGPLVDLDQVAQRRTGKKLNTIKVEYYLLARSLLNELQQLLAKFLNDDVVQNLVGRESYDRHALFIFDSNLFGVCHGSNLSVVFRGSGTFQLVITET